jgi:TPR repeat protein
MDVEICEMCRPDTNPLYLDGRGVRKDPKRALELYESSGSKGYVASQFIA